MSNLHLYVQSFVLFLEAGGTGEGRAGRMGVQVTSGTGAVAAPAGVGSEEMSLSVCHPPSAV